MQPREVVWAEGITFSRVSSPVIPTLQLQGSKGKHCGGGGRFSVHRMRRGAF